LLHDMKKMEDVGNYSLLYLPPTWSEEKGCAMAQAVSWRPLTVEAQVHAQVVHVEFVVDKVALGQVFLRVLWFFPVSIIPLWLFILT
jgi:hypothetical protein